MLPYLVSSASQPPALLSCLEPEGLICFCGVELYSL